MYADDITQIIFHPSPRQQFIRLTKDRAIAAINRFEEEWKIKNKNKFLIIPAARTKPGNPDLANIDVGFTKEGKLLGLKITNTGIAAHKERINIANNVLAKLKRFSGCPEDIKIYLYKMLVRPIFEYPPVPLNTMALSSWYKLQAIQNKAILWAKGIRWPNPRPSIRELHTLYKIDPINIRIHHQATRTWERLEYLEDANYESIKEAHTSTQGEHRW